LELSDDAAHANWGGAWRMPTSTEWSELYDQCTWMWTTQNGVNGYTVTGPNGSSIFLPTAGHYNGSYLLDTGRTGTYWLSSLSEGDSSAAAALYIGSGSRTWVSTLRFCGQSVRPVYGDLPDTPDVPDTPDTPE
jgi:hypothetical protein